MPIVEYPFQAQGPFSEAAPILPVKIINPGTNLVWPTWALVDTGATSCTIPGHVATVIGHNVVGPPDARGETGGGRDDIYLRTCRIEIFEMRSTGFVTNNVIITIPNGPVAVLPNLRVVLLGVDDFLEEYVLTIDYPRQVFSIRKPPPKKQKK